MATTSFAAGLHVARFDNAASFAAELFYESFAVAFPVPTDNCGFPFPTPTKNWHQYVALYKWPEGPIEPVGFCNWIRYDNVYLEGGMCVRRNFYRRLRKEHWIECRDAGGVAQIMMERAALQLNDCVAWFGYCGDRKASIVDARAGYIPTRHKFLIVKWFAELPDSERRALEDKVAAIGPF